MDALYPPGRGALGFRVYPAWWLLTVGFRVYPAWWLLAVGFRVYPAWWLLPVGFRAAGFRVPLTRALPLPSPGGALVAPADAK